MTLARTSRSRPCPICGKPDWCSLQLDDADEVIAAVCMRIESPRPTRNAGWYHRLRERARALPPVRRFTLRRLPDWSQLVAERCAETRDADLLPHAEALHVSLDSLRKLSCFRSRRFAGALCAPMLDGFGKARGVRLRYLNGRKLAVTGSREGIFAPDRIPGSRTLAIVEGFSDTAAGLDLAPDFGWLGRPSCTGALATTLEVARELAPAWIVVIADHDEPGQRGAATLAKALRLVTLDVRVVIPPAKDLRAAVCLGFTLDDLLAQIDAATPLIPPRMVTA